MRSSNNKADAGVDMDKRQTAVKPLRYLQDRLSYIAAFAAALLLSETALILGALSGPGDVDPMTAVYAGVLAFSCLFLWLGYDYLRHALTIASWKKRGCMLPFWMPPFA